MLTWTLVFTLNAVKHWNISTWLKIALAPWDIQMLPEFLCLDMVCGGIALLPLCPLQKHTWKKAVFLSAFMSLMSWCRKWTWTNKQAALKIGFGGSLQFHKQRIQKACCYYFSLCSRTLTLFWRIWNICVNKHKQDKTVLPPQVVSSHNIPLREDARMTFQTAEPSG